MLKKASVTQEVKQSDLTLADYQSYIKTGDDTVDIDSATLRSLPITVAKLIKKDRVETIFNGHAGIKASNINIEADLKDKNTGKWVFARVRAIDACGYEKTAGSKPPEGNNEDLHGANDNGDYFSVEELLKEREHEGKLVHAFETFVGVPFFTNHQNDDIEKARGKIVNAFYDLKENCVYCDVMIDGESYPKLAKGIKDGYMTDVSMGALMQDSRILMSDGSTKTHREIKLGDLVITHTGQVQPVTAIARSNEPITYFEIDWVGSDTSIKASSEHPFYVISCADKSLPENCNATFVEAMNLKVGDFVLSPTSLNSDIAEGCFVWNGYLCSPISKVEQKTSSEEDVFYHIEVGGNENPEIDGLSDHSYIADGIAVHNCAVEFSACSICGNKAANSDSYCTHIRNMKGKTVQGKKVYEINHGLKFIEISAVTDGACENCKVKQILSPEQIMEKVAREVNDLMKKVASVKSSPSFIKTASSNCPPKSFNELSEIKMAMRQVAFKQTIKTASKEDLQSLYEALQQLKKVTIKIIESEDVDYEFVEDLSSVLASLQNLIVDLAEAGFGEAGEGAPQGGGEGGGVDAMVGAEESDSGQSDMGATPAGEGAPEAAAPPEAAGQAPAAQAPAQASLSKQKLTKVAEDMEKISENLIKILGGAKTSNSNITRGIPSKRAEYNRIAIQTRVAKNWNTIINKESSMSKNFEIKDKDYSVKVAGGNISGFYQGEKIAEVSVDKLPAALAAAYKADPQEAAKLILTAWRGGMTAEAYHKNAPPVEQTMEGQIENLDGNFKRVRPVHEENYEIFEGRLDDIPTSAETGDTHIKLDGTARSTGETNFGRKDWANDLPVFEKQLEESNKRLNDGQAAADHGVIEAQLSDEKSKYEFNRVHDGQAPADLPTFEGQFEGKDRLGYAIEEVQEGQLKSHRQGPDAYMAAAASTVDSLVKAAARCVVEKGFSPTQISQAFASLTKEYKSAIPHYAKVVSNEGGMAHLAKRLRAKTASSELTKKDLVVALMDRVAEATGKERYNPYILAEAIDTLASDMNATEAAVKVEVENEINRVKAAAAGKSNVQLKENNIKAALKQSLMRKAGLEEIEAEYEIDFDESDVNGLAPTEAGFHENLVAAVVDTLAENQIYTTASQIQIKSVKTASNGGGVAYVDLIPNAQGPNKFASKIDAVKSLLSKVAQTAPTGSQFGDPSAGGAAPAAGGDPAAGGAAGALSTPPPDFDPDESAPADDAGAGDEQGEIGSGEPKFPGDVCPMCGNSEIDTLDDHFVCKNCDTQFDVKVDVSILNPNKALGSGSDTEDQGAEESETGAEDAATEGADVAPVGQPATMPAAPAGGANPAGGPAGGGQIPAMASFTVHPRIMLRTANSLGRLPRIGEAVAIGERCPNCGSGKTVLENNSGLCVACGCDYTVKVARSKRADRLNVTIAWLASGRKLDITKCRNCRAAVRKFEKKVASLNTNRKRLLRTASLNIESDKQALDICTQDRMRDGFSRRASVHICGCTKASFEMELLKKTAQIAGSDEEEDMGKFDNPMNDIKDKDMLNGDESQFSDVDDEEFEAGEDAEDGSDTVEDSYDEEDGYIHNLPETGESDDMGVDQNTGNKLKVHIDVTGCPADGCGSDLYDSESGTCPECGYTSGPKGSIDLTIDTQSGSVEVDSDTISGGEEYGPDDFGGDDMDAEDMSGEGFDEFESEDSSDFDADGDEDFDADESEDFESEDGDEFGDDEDYIDNSDEMEDRDELADSFEEDSDELLDSVENLKDGIDDEFEADEDGDSDDDFEDDDEDSEDDEDDDDEIVQESDEDDDDEDDSKIPAEAMSASRITSAGKFAGSNLNIDYVAAKLGLKKSTLKNEAKKLAGQHPLLRKASDIKLSKTANMLGGVKLAQTSPTKQTMPLDIEDEVDGGVPRDESVGFKQTSPTEIKKVKKNPKSPERGKSSGGETDVVPRDGSGDGLGGRKVTFEAEKSEDATSGNPDSYVQKLQETIKPKPRGSKENHAVASAKQVIDAFAAKNKISTRDLEIADFGPFYVVAYGQRAFKVRKAGYRSDNLKKAQKASFRHITVVADVDGSIDKVAGTNRNLRIAESEDEGPDYSFETGGKKKINKGWDKKSPAGSKENHGTMGPNTAKTTKTVRQASEDTIKPNKVDGKKNKGVMPHNGGYNTACSDKKKINKGWDKKSAPKSKENHATMGPNTASQERDVKEASEDTIKPTPKGNKKNKCCASTAKQAAEMVSKAKGITIARLEVADFGDVFGVMDTKTSKLFQVRKQANNSFFLQIQKLATQIDDPSTPRELKKQAAAELEKLIDDKIKMLTTDVSAMYEVSDMRKKNPTGTLAKVLDRIATAAKGSDKVLNHQKKYLKKNLPNMGKELRMPPKGLPDMGKKKKGLGEE